MMTDQLPQAASIKQVFISHAEEDAEFAHRLADDLKRPGVGVWIAPDSILPGEGWVDAIERGLRESSHMVIVLTPAAVKSQWVKMETNTAITLERQGRIEVIPLDVAPAEAPAFWKQYQMISFRPDYDAGLNRLCTVLGISTTPEVATPKVEPERAEPRIRKKRAGQAWGWRRSPLLLAPVALLVVALVIGIVVIGLGGDGGEPTSIPTTLVPGAVEEPMPTPTATVTASIAPIETPKPPSNASLHDTWTRHADGMEMVYVPGGTFEMGSTQDEIDAALEQCKSDRGPDKCEQEKFDDEYPPHSVTLDSFWIDRTEVTNAQYARCVSDDKCDPPARSSSERYDSYYGNRHYDDYPVIWVDWYDADAYCKWAGGRLPTEAEWEYAARGQDRSLYPWGDDAPNDTLLNYNWHEGDTTQVGSYPEGASWVGAMDMAGNAWEWANDRYAEDYYARSPAKNPTGPDTGHNHVLRGGSFSRDPVNVRAAYRDGTPPNFDYWNIGFRCVVEPGD